MHDPCTVGLEIRYPWRAHRNPRNEWEKRYRSPFITIWHVDPQKDGSDDSCGFSFPKLTKQQRERLKNLAFWEGNDPYYLRCAAKEWNGTATEAETLFRAMILQVAQALNIRMSFDEAAAWAATRMHIGGIDGKPSLFCFLPGYHTNRLETTKDDRADIYYGRILGIARELLQRRRRWWQHPRWHIRHWKIQCHPLQQFKRWAFSRCAGCGKSFGFGESPTTHQWDSEGPKWFRGERGMFHGACANAKPAGAAP